MDKIEKFRRINTPRVERALEQIALVEKSAASMRIPEAVATLLAEHGLRLASAPAPAPAQAPASAPAAPEPAVIEATPPVAKEMARLVDLSTMQLVDRMIACGAELARRRK